jgi:hypothetical protein
VRNYNIAFKVLLDQENEVAYAYHIVGVPTYVLIDKKGVIRYKGNSFPGSEIKQLSYN